MLEAYKDVFLIKPIQYNQKFLFESLTSNPNTNQV